MADGGAVTGVLIENLVIRGLNGQEAFNRTVLDPLRTIYNAGYDRPIVMLVDSLDEALASATEVTIVDLLAGLQGLDAPRAVHPHQPRRATRREPLPWRKRAVPVGSRLHRRQQPGYPQVCDAPSTRRTRLKSKVAALTPAQAAALPDQITGKAEGNFLYGVFLLNAAAEGQQALDALDGLPSGLDGLYYNSLERIVRLGKKDWSTVYKPLLGVLSVAQEPITLAQVQAYTGLPGDAWEALLDLRQFVETSPERFPPQTATRSRRTDTGCTTNRWSTSCAVARS